MEKKIDWAKVKKTAETVGNVLIWLFVAFSFLVTVLVFTSMGNSSGVPEVFGKSLITISTDSMEPNIKQHALVLLDRLEPGEIYDLQGRKLDEVTKPGIYIIDGEKDHSECEGSLIDTILTMIFNIIRSILGLNQKCVCGDDL